MLAFLYFQDEDHYLERKKNEGFFRIDDCTSIDVIPEHLGRKNAFCIATPRSKYYLVSESRYELHHWLLALHGALDDYRESNPQLTNSGKKKPTRQRSKSTINPTSPQSSLTRSTTPRKKPSRPAPPAPPKDKKKGNEENEPPPVQSEPQTPVTSEPLHNLPSPTTNKLDDIVAGLLQQSNEHTAFEYTLTEDEDIPLVNGENNHDEETGSLSTSLPTLNKGESNSDDCPSPNHTRHLSFSDSYEFNGKRGGKKKKRPGSMKGRRSVSPPNLPPPPPPPTDNEQQLEYNREEQEISTNEQGEKQKEMSTNKSSPRPHPPQRTTSLNPNQPQNDDDETNAVSKYLDEAFNQEDDCTINTSSGSSKSPGILRKGEQCRSLKRNVVFDEHVKGRYEPMVDHESLPSTVAQAKAKLFGGNEAAESFRYNRSQLQSYSNVEPQDELLEAIESALQPTSYMEQGKETGPGLTIDVGPPTIPPPTRPEGNNSEGPYSLETSPNEMSKLASPPAWTNPKLDDSPTTTTFTADHDTMYRSIV